MLIYEGVEELLRFLDVARNHVECMLEKGHVMQFRGSGGVGWVGCRQKNQRIMESRKRGNRCFRLLKPGDDVQLKLPKECRFCFFVFGLRCFENEKTPEMPKSMSFFGGFRMFGFGTSLIQLLVGEIFQLTAGFFALKRNMVDRCTGKSIHISNKSAINSKLNGA